jgi:predicted SAM-dependent methyltransferase
MSLRVNIGCGKSPTDGWLNMDNSISIKIANSSLLYFFAKIFGLLNTKQIEYIEWIKSNKIQFANATKKLPLKDSSVECIYTSHMIEHLSRDGVLSFLKDALRVLNSGGVLRIAVPDLNILLNEYLHSKDADQFMSSSYVQAPPIKTIKQKIQLFISGYRHHQWMYDGVSLSKLLREVGFRDVVVCKNGFTKILNPGKLNLYEREKQSVYVEGIKL